MDRTRLPFVKMHGQGNDFVVVDAVRRDVSLTAHDVRFLADRHRGVGCDQLLLVEPARDPGNDFRYRIFNSDGGEVEQCGNGARCFARFVRDEGLTYFLGNRYIDELGSNITSIALSYQLSPKYTLTFAQNYDFGLGQNVSTGIALLRQFDAFFVQVSVGHDNTTDQSSFNFNIYPKGLGYGVNAEQLSGVFRNER